MIRRPPRSTLFPTRRSSDLPAELADDPRRGAAPADPRGRAAQGRPGACAHRDQDAGVAVRDDGDHAGVARSEEHTSELQSRQYLVCRLLLEKKKTHYKSQIV